MSFISRSIVVVVVLACLITLVSATAPSNVVELDTSNFDYHTQDNSVWFIKFYGPKCGHCKRLTANWEALADRVEADGIKIKIAKVDATKNAPLAQRLGAYPWPSLQLLKGGQSHGDPNSRNHAHSSGVDEMLSFAIDKFPEIVERSDKDL
jgi:thioredoxin-like negative regulator of GroEL